MPHRIQFVSAAIGILLLMVIFQLIRKNRLLEQYALLWIASAVLLLVVSIWRNLLEKLAGWAGIYYAPSALFLVALFCGMVIALHFSVVISQIKKQNHALAQEVALLRHEVDLMRKPKRRSGKGRPAADRSGRRSQAGP
jgi:hypothetical protein